MRTMGALPTFGRAIASVRARRGENRATGLANERLVAFGRTATALIARAAHPPPFVGFRALPRQGLVGNALAGWANPVFGHVTDKHGCSSETTPLLITGGKG
jgi:hypothetical protein